jgi:hypothetical protein
VNHPHQWPTPPPPAAMRAIRLNLGALSLAVLGCAMLLASACGDDDSGAATSPLPTSVTRAASATATAKPAGTAAKQPTSSSSTAPIALSDWATRFCAASQLFEDSVSAIASPKGKSVDEQKKLEPEILKQFSNAVDTAVSSISSLKPPESARTYQDSNVAQLKNLKQIETAAGASVARATTADDIAQVGKTEQAAVQQAQADFDQATKQTPAEVVAALKAVKKCGSVHS